MYQHIPHDIVEHVDTKIKIFERFELWDRHWWMDNSNGRFFVKSASELLRHKKHKDENIVKLWMQELPFKIFFFLVEGLKLKDTY